MVSNSVGTVRPLGSGSLHLHKPSAGNKGFEILNVLGHRDLVRAGDLRSESRKNGMKLQLSRERGSEEEKHIGRCELELRF